MAHTIYTTEGFILKSLNFGEANKYFFIFTQDFGLVKATAQSVRHLKSKLRYSLEDFSFSSISMVRGREVWRITSAEKKLNLKENKNFSMLANVFSLLLRLLHGEERNELLFESVKEGMFFLEKNELNGDNLNNFECIMALRVLSALGYIGSANHFLSVGQADDFDEFTTSPYFTSELLEAMSSIRTKAILEINKSLKETHL